MTLSLMPPEAETPAITYFIVQEKPHVDTCGNLHKDTRFQMNIWHTDAATVETIYEAAVTLLHKYNGTHNSQDIVSIIQDFGMTTYEPETKRYRHICDWKVVAKGL